MASTIKVNNIQNQCGSNIANKCGSTVTLGASGDTITLACGASQTGFGRTGTVDWDTTAKTASFTAVSGNGYFVNTTSGVITVTLPAGSAGDIISLADYSGTWQTNAVTVTPNGTDKIGGVNTSVGLSTEGQSVTFIYTDSTQGWLNTMDSTSNVRGNPFIAATGGTITTSGDYKIHTFTGPGTFTVTNAGAPTGSDTVDYLVVAGGGAGGNNLSGGGGGGGFRESSGTASGCYTASPLGACVSALPVTVTGYPITVGGGGTVPTCNDTAGGSGSNSVFSTITSAGGGGGGGGSGAGSNALDGGNGGGTSGYSSNPGGCGNTPPVSPPQGNNGGGGGFAAPGYPGGGGGGASAAGTQTPSGTGPGSAGGAGIQTNIDTNNYYWSGGGGGGSYNQPVGNNGGAGGIGGGGGGGTCTPGSGGTGGGSAINSGSAGTAGPPSGPVTGGAGGANSGGGGGGSGHAGGAGRGAAGGSGIVIIRYKYQ